MTRAPPPPDPWRAVLAGLRRRGVDVDLEQALDAAWVAREIRRSPDRPPSAELRERPALNEAPGDGATTGPGDDDASGRVEPVVTPPPQPPPAPECGRVVVRTRAPRVRAHFDPEGVRRAFRGVRFEEPDPDPSRWTLDEEATAQRLADLPRAPPVLRAPPRKRAHLDLVIDVGPTMDPWWPRVQGLVRTLRSLGVFHELHVWTLDSGAGEPALRLGVPGRPAAREVAAERWARQGGRDRTTLLVSDLTGPYWTAGTGWKELAAWARAAPLAVAHVRRHRSWGETALAWGVPGVLSASEPLTGWEHHLWHTDSRWREREPAVRLPVVRLASEGLARWADWLVARGPVHAFEVAELPSEADLAELVGERDVPPDGASAVTAFLRRCSPEAARLVPRLLCAPWLSLRTLELVRAWAGMADDAEVVAEILQSGLLLPDGERSTDLDRNRWTMGPGVAAALATRLPLDERLAGTRHLLSVLELGGGWQEWLADLSGERPSADDGEATPGLRDMVEWMESHGVLERVRRARERTVELPRTHDDAETDPTPFFGPTSEGVPARQHWALVIGIGHYAGFPLLTSITRTHDAHHVSQWLRGTGEFLVRTLIDVGAHIDILDSMRDIVSRAAPDSALFVYVSGLGVATPNGLALIASDDTDPRLRAISLEEWAEFIRTAGSFSEVVAVVDLDLVRAQYAPTTPAPFLRAPAGPRPRRCLVLTGRAGEGALTRAFLDGVTRAAGPDGRLSAQALVSFVTKHMNTADLESDLRVSMSPRAGEWTLVGTRSGPRPEEIGEGPDYQVGRATIHVRRGVGPRAAGATYCSTDAAGNPGQLQAEVFSALNLPPELPPGARDDLADRGWTIVPHDSGEVRVVVTVRSGSTAAHELSRNFDRAFAYSHRQDTIWIPAMGTGAGRLSIAESARLIFSVIRERAGSLTPGTRIVFSVPGRPGNLDDVSEVAREVLGSSRVPSLDREGVFAPDAKDAAGLETDPVDPVGLEAVLRGATAVAPVDSVSAAVPWELVRRHTPGRALTRISLTRTTNEMPKTRRVILWDRTPLDVRRKRDLTEFSLAWAEHGLDVDPPTRLLREDWRRGNPLRGARPRGGPQGREGFWGAPSPDSTHHPRPEKLVPAVVHVLCAYDSTHQRVDLGTHESGDAVSAADIATLLSEEQPFVVLHVVGPYLPPAVRARNVAAWELSRLGLPRLVAIGPIPTPGGARLLGLIAEGVASGDDQLAARVLLRGLDAENWGDLEPAAVSTVVFTDRALDPE